MNKYLANIFENGRIALIEEKDYRDAIEQGKEILVFCGGKSGGHVRIFDAGLADAWYNSNGRFDCFSCQVDEKTFTPDQIAKFYRIIVTDGIKVYMRTGNPASSYVGEFYDFRTTFEEYMNGAHSDRTTTLEEFNEMRHEIDVEMTLDMISGDEKEDIVNTIKRQLR